MRMVSTQRLETGMYLAKHVFAEDGRILLKEGVQLTDAYIRRLRKMAFTYLYVEDSDTSDIVVEDTVSVEVQQHVVREIKRICDKMADPVQLSQVVNSGELGTVFTELFDILFDHLRRNDSFLLNLSSIYANDAYLYKHCMNVGIMASVLGAAKGYREDRIKQLGVGAMLHDIGKLQISREILDKPGKLTAEERLEIAKHCEFGYEMLIKQTDLSATSAHCALQHHEKYDGTGYPRALRGNEIHEFGRLLSVPDVFDALTSNRVYRKAFLPHEAVEYLYSNIDTHFDKEFVELFTHHVNIYPNGLPVTLSNGMSGVVARANPSNVQRPVILVFQESGHKVPSAFELDLSSHRNIVISGCDIDGMTQADPAAHVFSK